MFITQSREIIEGCPTAKLDAKDAQRLLRCVQEEESQLLEDLIGESLMLYLEQQYSEWVDEFGGITTDKIDVLHEDSIEKEKWSVMQRTLPLLRDIQSALVYRMFANKIYTLSTSLNLGGGANRASAGDYDPADDKHLRELRLEMWKNSMHACDNVLLALEKDAKSAKPLWLELWKESDSYYVNEELLFPTLRSAKRYLTCDSPTKYLTLRSVIQYCQDTFISPRVNEVAPDLMDRLLDVTSNLTDEEKKAQKLLRQALACYIKAKDGDKAERNEALMTADSSFGTAMHYITQHFVKVDLPETEQKPCCECCQPREREEYSMFSTLMPGVNRF